MKTKIIAGTLCASIRTQFLSKLKEGNPNRVVYSAYLNPDGKVKEHYNDPRFESANPPGWADPLDPFSIDPNNPASLITDVLISRDAKGYLNPYLRPGQAPEGRGIMGKYWWRNRAADGILTYLEKRGLWCSLAAGIVNLINNGRFVYARPLVIKVLLVQRASGKWALPGGMLDYHKGKIEDTTAGLLRELSEEAGTDVARKVKILIEMGGKWLYKGYTDDSRNTLRAWIETNVMHINMLKEWAQSLKLRPMDKKEILGIKWQEISKDNLHKMPDLYSVHNVYILMAIADLADKGLININDYKPLFDKYDYVLLGISDQT